MSPVALVLSGVAGSGKSTLARAIADRTGWALAEGDVFHSVDNISKMAAGTPLTDEDRAPWLAAIGGWADECHSRGDSSVITCSALRRRYRDELRIQRPWLVFCLLEASYDVLAERLGDRPGHFMPASLLDSQLATLEPIADQESGFAVDAAQPPDALAQAVLDRIGWRARGS